MKELPLPEKAVCLIAGTFVQARLFVDANVITKIDLIDRHPDLSQATHFVIPGLIDTHVHLTACTANLGALTRLTPSLISIAAAEELRHTLRRGFTTVRDAGGADCGLADASEQGLILTPRCTRVLFVGHAISQTGGHGDMRGKGEEAISQCGCCASSARGIGVVADGVAECRKVCRDELRKGAHAIKIMASGGVASPTDALTDLQFSNDEISAFVDEAARKGTYVMAHAYTAEAILRAIQLGVTSIEHGNYLNEEAADAMAQMGASLSQTIITYVALQEEGEKHGMPLESVHKVADLVHAGMNSIQIATKAGVNCTYGSDLLGGMRVRQLEGFKCLLDAGMSTLEALRTANENAAFLLGINAGEIKLGRLADVVVLNVNVLEVSNMRNWTSANVEQVFVGGERIEL